MAEPPEPKTETPAPAAEKKAAPKTRPKPAAPKTTESKPGGPSPSPSASSTPKSESKPADRPKSEAKAAPKPAPAAPAKPVPAKTLVDVSGLVLGRAASKIAPRLLKGEWIVVVHAEQCVITGSRELVLETYRANRARGSKRSGPHFPRYADRIFRRTVRGMLPHLKTRGKEALDRLEVHIGVPPEYAGQATQSIEEAKARPALRAPITLGEVTRNLGAPAW